MANFARNIAASCFLLAGFVAALAAQQPTHSTPSGDDDQLSLITPAGYQTQDWVPVVVVWWAAEDESLKQLCEALAASGFVVVPLVQAPDAKALQAMLTKLRQRVRIAQGSVHALVAHDPAAAIAALLAQRHEFQTVTVCGAAAEADLRAVRRLPKRRVHALAGTDAVPLRDHLKLLHQHRELTGPARGVSQCLDSFHDAAAVADEDRYFAILPDDAVFLGTDATERWTGKQFREFAMRYFKLPSAWTYVPLERHVTLSPDGKLAWFDEALDNAGYGECRGSGVLQERDGHWVLLQYNLTVPVPNELMGGVAKRIRAHLDGEMERGK